MGYRMSAFSLCFTATAMTALCVGCADKLPQGPAAPAKQGDGHPEGGHAPDHAVEHDGHDAHAESSHSGETHAHVSEALTEKDVDLPANAALGVSRLETLHVEIANQIEQKHLERVHHIAEEMAIVAKNIKKLAANEVAEKKLTEVGRLCNEIAGYYEPLDEAANAGRTAETAEIHEKMGKAIERLSQLTR